MKDHIVQFYKDEAFLAQRVSDWLENGLDTGAACVVVATQAHRNLVRERLRSSRTDLDRAVQESRFVELDAAEVLAQVMVDGLPDAGRFRQVVGLHLVRVRARYPDVRAYGEMVALLCEQGNSAAAIRLEVLWNELMREQTLSLLCGYPMRVFQEQNHCDALLQICAEHSQILPADSADTGAATPRFRTRIDLQSRA